MLPPNGAIRIVASTIPSTATSELYMAPPVTFKRLSSRLYPGLPITFHSAGVLRVGSSGGVSSAAAAASSPNVADLPSQVTVLLLAEHCDASTPHFFAAACNIMCRACAPAFLNTPQKPGVAVLPPVSWRPIKGCTYSSRPVGCAKIAPSNLHSNSSANIMKRLVPDP